MIDKQYVSLPRYNQKESRDQNRNQNINQQKSVSSQSHCQELRKHCGLFQSRERSTKARLSEIEESRHFVDTASKSMAWTKFMLSKDLQYILHFVLQDSL
jgi:hypothetical protein